MGRAEDLVEQDYTTYRLLLDLWARENPTKTMKLQVFLAVEAILVSAMTLSGGFVPGNWPLCLAGAAFSLIWAISIGRTSLYQAVWRLKIEAMAERYPEEPRFHIHDPSSELERVPRALRAVGSVPSKYYLIGAPVILCLAWCGALVFLVI